MIDNRSLNSFRTDLDKKGFDDMLLQNGTLLKLERNLLCPCRNETTDLSARTACSLCKGTGYLFDKPKEVRGMISGLSYEQKIGLDYEMINATANLTLTEDYDYRLDYFDKLTVIDGDGIICNSLINFSQYTNYQNQIVLQAVTPFVIKKVEALFLRKSDTEIVTLGSSDFTYKDNIITLSAKWKHEFKDVKNIVGSIRFYHLPIYHVLTTNHVIRMSRIKDVSNLLPLQYTIRVHKFFNEYGNSIEIKG